MPLVLELTRDIKRWLTPAKLRELNAVWRTQGEAYPDSVIEDCAGILGRSDLHYENILGHLEIQGRRQNDQKLRQKYFELYSWLVDLVYRMLYFRQINNHDFFARHLPFYDGLKALTDANQPLWIFSLNHDLIIETLAARHGIPIACGYSSAEVSLPTRHLTGAIKGSIRARVLTKDNIDRQALHFDTRPHHGINLLKLHGSLDEFAFNDGHDLLKLLPAEPTERSVIETLKAANEDLLYLHPGFPGGRVHCTNEIAYADEHGIMQFLRRSLLAGAFKFDQRSSQTLPRTLLNHFRTNINFVNHLVVIGYSFGDKHINEIVRHWLEFSADRSVEIVDPSVVAVPGCLQHMTPQVTLTRSTTTAWLDAKAGITRTIKEKSLNNTVSTLRIKGYNNTQQGMLQLMQQEVERLMGAATDFLRGLPKKANGNPEFSAIGDPVELASSLAEKTIGSEEDRHERVLKYFADREKQEKDGNAGKA